MKQRIYPIIVSTMEALRLSIMEEYSVIYVEGSLFAEEEQKIRKLMKINGYIIPKKKGKTGVFFAKGTGPSAFNPKTYEIYDPYNTL